MVKEQNYKYPHSPFCLFLSPPPSASLVPLQGDSWLAQWAVIL